MKNAKGHFINGAWQNSGGAALQSINPANGKVIFECQEVGQAEVDAAVKSGQAAFGAWSKRSFEERADVVQKFKSIVERRKQELAEAVSNEMGKAMWEASAEIGGVIGKVDISIKAYHERTGKHVTQQKGFNNRLEHRPHGVMAVYGPFNFPAHLPNGHMVPALLAGNCVILKPSELTPYVGQLLVECWQEAGIPNGVVQLVQGAKDTGIALSKHDGLSGILFTGSVATGIALHKQCAGKLDRVLALELGGHNPLIVWDAKDVDAAVELIIQSAFVTTGQRCTCARRLIVKDDAATEALLNALMEKTRQLTYAAWDNDPTPFMGPLVSKQAADGAMKEYAALKDMGAKVLLEITQPNGDAFITPGIIDVTSLTDAPDEEIFAPLLKVCKVADFKAALAEANNTRYGLSAGILTDDQALAEQFLSEIKAGVVSVNRPTTGASGAMPFGGVGLSGNHHPAAYYAADYCAYPVAMQVNDTLEMPTSLPIGSAAK